MPRHFTEEENMLLEIMREFTANEVGPRNKWMDENGFDQDLYKKMVEAGIIGILFDRSYEGTGG